MNWEDILSGTCADLVSEFRYKPFLRQLFSQSPGVWLEVLPMCEEKSTAWNDLVMVEQTVGRSVKVNWLNYPYYNTEESYCTITFLIDAPLWSTTAIFNLSTLTPSI